ncbi:MAG: NAD-dependent epimerase/dehydratase family protein [Microbacteriaceae bacterium]
MRRVLILGGTAWLGKEIARAALADGAEVVCLARGDSGDVPDGATLVVADRSQPDAYEGLLGDWDEVVEISYEPDFVRSALDALAGRAKHWTLISSCSVYLRNDEPGADESAELVSPDNLTNYADAKALAEKLSISRLGEKLLIARPGLIAGPGDGSDRFGYWPARLALGGRVLIPVVDQRFVQVVDIEDLAIWVIEAGRLKVSGIMNVVGHVYSFAEFLAEVARVTNFSGDFVSVDDTWLLENRVNYWAGPHSLTLWLPLVDTAFTQRSNARYLAHGGRIRDLSETIRRVLGDEQSRGLNRERRSGLSLVEEAILLEKLQHRSVE